MSSGSSSSIPSTIAAPEIGPMAHPEGVLRRLWEKWHETLAAVPETQFFLLLAVLIGVFSGLAVVCFRISIEWVSIALLGTGAHRSTLNTLAVPTLIGLVVAVLVQRVFPRARGSGVNQTKAAVYIFDGYVPFNTVIGKFICCALAIGSGQSLGPEDPSLQMGAGIASKLGRKLHLSQDKLRLIAPVGAAAGLAAAFNAPVAAVLFVIEEIIGTWSGGVLGAIILSAVSSVVVMRWFLGPEPLFRIPPFEITHPSELIGYAALGVIGGVASLIMIKFIAGVRPRLAALPKWVHYFLPAIAGLMIGFIGLRLPQVMGAGYPVIDQALHSQYTWKMLLVLGAFKILATGLSFNSGTPGGMFAPTLFIGAMLGGAVGGVEHLLFHRLTGTVGTFALVGMGTLFAGFLRTPITSIFMVVEVSGSYSAVIPVMVSSLIAYLISRQYQKVPLFDILSRQDGVVLPSLEHERERITLRVEDAMRIPSEDAQRPGEPIKSAIERAIDTGKPDFIVREDIHNWVLIEGSDYPRFGDFSADTLPAGENGSKRLPVLYPDQPLEEALSVIQIWPVLPVVSRADLGHLEGVINLADVLRVYREARQV
jgi:chloride channel protein, CIC family